MEAARIVVAYSPSSSYSRDAPPKTDSGKLLSFDLSRVNSSAKRPLRAIQRLGAGIVVWIRLFTPSREYMISGLAGTEPGRTTSGKHGGIILGTP